MSTTATEMVRDVTARTANTEDGPVRVEAWTVTSDEGVEQRVFLHWSPADDHELTREQCRALAALLVKADATWSA